MSNQNCIATLLKEHDFNVQCTSFVSKPYSADNKLQWINTICNSIGHNIIHSTAQFFVKIYLYSASFEISCKGNKIKEELAQRLTEPCSIRIEITTPFGERKCWIIFIFNY